MKSSLRDALDTMSVSKSGRPRADLIRMTARLGSTLPETACVLDTEVERIIDIVEGRARLSINEADILHAYLLSLWWWHSYRMNYKGSVDQEAVRSVHSSLSAIWERLPQALRKDWKDATETF